MIIYAKSSGHNNAAIGQLETPIKMIIEHESDLLTKKGGICDSLFNVEKSSRFGETIVGGREFNMFSATEEGEAADQDTIMETYQKFIEHIQFTKEFIITAEMMEDANYGVAADAKHRAENFTRAYYKTINRICEAALINATQSSTEIANTTLDLTTFDGEPLFFANHRWSLATGNQLTQSNYFWGDVFGKTKDGVRTYSTDVFEESLYALVGKLRGMLDERGEPLGYTADTIVLPGNNPKLESIVKKVCGSDGALGNGYNDINLHYGNWNIVVLPSWQPQDMRIMVMSSEANKNMCGNMFFNRIPLTVTNWVDHHTGNYIWNGRCRFGVGFGTYKHILMAVDSASAIQGASHLMV
ncbi:MAG: hypothetical protein IKW53_06375 [Clostridia bacterium]|nr:hypothetical protein [Clostridia bacterium]